MARPSPNIVCTYTTSDNVIWDVTVGVSQYTITYQGQPCGVRQHVHTLNTHGYKYQKLSYTNYGNAQAQANRLNKKFNTTDFGVSQVA